MENKKKVVGKYEEVNQKKKQGGTQESVAQLWWFLHCCAWAINNKTRQGSDSHGGFQTPQRRVESSRVESREKKKKPYRIT